MVWIVFRLLMLFGLLIKITTRACSQPGEEGCTTLSLKMYKFRSMEVQDPGRERRPVDNAP